MYLNFNLMFSELLIPKGLPCGFDPVGFKQILLSINEKKMNPME